MSTKIEPAFFDRSQAVDTDGTSTSATVPYFVFDVADEDEALAYAAENTSTYFSGMPRTSIDIDERINENTFKVTVKYQSSSSSLDIDDNEPEPTFSFDTGGATMHLSQSLDTDGIYPDDAPDYGGAIGYDGENVNGVDVVQPVMNFSETHYFKPSRVTTSFKRTIARLTGTVNNDSFRGYDAGEVLFLGASGTRRGTSSKSLWEITYRFSVSLTKEDFDVGDISISRKSGWDYLWVRYADTPEDGEVLKKPSSAYVERVYERESFGSLGLGKGS